MLSLMGGGLGSLQRPPPHQTQALLGRRCNREFMHNVKSIYPTTLGWFHIGVYITFMVGSLMKFTIIFQKRRSLNQIIITGI